MTTKKKSLPRRDFLKAAGVTGGVAGVAAVALASKSATAAVPEGRKSAGYRERRVIAGLRGYRLCFLSDGLWG